MKKRLLGIMMGLAVAAIAGCSSGNGDGEAAATTGEAGAAGTTAAGEAEPAKDEKITLRYSFWGSTNEKDAITKSCEAFTEQNPNIEVEIIHIPTDYEAKLSAMIAGGEEPDLANLRDYFAMPLAESGVILPV